MQCRRTFRTLDELPLFASDHEIAVAVVGPERAGEYAKEIIPLLEKHPATRLTTSCTKDAVGRPCGGSTMDARRSLRRT
jgi:hypothetical protein